MNHDRAVQALAALASPSRLTIFRLVVRGEPAGIKPGELAILTSLPGATLSFHLKRLTAAGLIRQRREGRSIYYTRNPAFASRLAAYITEQCCRGAR